MLIRNYSPKIYAAIFLSFLAIVFIFRVMTSGDKDLNPKFVELICSTVDRMQSTLMKDPATGQYVPARFTINCDCIKDEIGNALSDKQLSLFQTKIIENGSANRDSVAKISKLSSVYPNEIPAIIDVYRTLGDKCTYEMF